MFQEHETLSSITNFFIQSIIIIDTHTHTHTHTYIYIYMYFEQLERGVTSKITNFPD